MPNTKKSDSKASEKRGGKQSGKDKKDHGMQPGAMPHIPTARERARDMDDSRRSDAQTFEL